jgi:hypothetical protein
MVLLLYSTKKIPANMLWVEAEGGRICVGSGGLVDTESGDSMDCCQVL